MEPDFRDLFLKSNEIEPNFWDLFLKSNEMFEPDFRLFLKSITQQRRTNINAMNLLGSAFEAMIFQVANLLPYFNPKS